MCTLTASQLRAAGTAVIGQNNFAVSQIERGNYKTAIQALSSALQTYKQEVISKVFDGCPLPETSNIPLGVCMTRETPQVRHHHDSENRNNRYIYRQPIRIPLDIETDLPLSTMASLMIIFNLALAYHLLSEGTTSEDDQAILRKAAYMYAFSYRLLQDTQCYRLLQDTKYLWSSSMFFTMTLLNNLGVTYDRLNDQATSVGYFEGLLSCLVCLVEARNLVVCKAVDGFLRNVSIVHHCPAPAA